MLLSRPPEARRPAPDFPERVSWKGAEECRDIVLAALSLLLHLVACYPEVEVAQSLDFAQAGRSACTGPVCRHYLESAPSLPKTAQLHTLFGTQWRRCKSTMAGQGPAFLHASQAQTQVTHTGASQWEISMCTFAISVTPCSVDTGGAAQSALIVQVVDALGKGLSPGARRALTLWLGGCAGWVFSMVVLGGMTRLTRSGLSMTDWKFTGERAPRSQVQSLLSPWGGLPESQAANLIRLTHHSIPLCGRPFPMASG